MPSKRSLLPWWRAVPCLGQQKLRAKPSFTRTVSPIWPSFATCSTGWTSMSVTPSEGLWCVSSDDAGGCSRWGLTPEIKMELATRRRQQHRRPPENEQDQVDRGQDKDAVAERSRDVVQDCKSYQGVGDDEGAGDDAAIMPIVPGTSAPIERSRMRWGRVFGNAGAGSWRRRFRCRNRWRRGPRCRD